MTSTLQSHGPLLQGDSAIMGVPALQRGSCVNVRIRQTKQLTSQAPDVHKLPSRSLRSVPQLGDMMGQTFGLSGKDVLLVPSSILHFFVISAFHHTQTFGLENWVPQTAAGIWLGGSLTSLYRAPTN